MLRKLADLCKKQVADNGICGRLSSDRFAVMRKRGVKYSEEYFQELITKVNVMVNCSNNVIVKWGIYEITDRTIPVEQMCDRALMAADSIKGQYHKYFTYYDSELRSKLLREQAITEGMELALSGEQFSVFFQPKYSLKDCSLAGAEAIVRWDHPYLGAISPGEFVPLFEKNGFITWMDQFVWNRTCELIREWKKKGYPMLPISVNVSRADIYRVDLVDILLKIVRKQGTSPSDLHLEITESAYTEDSAQIICTVAELRDKGFIIEMDDFGSGYSSLNMLNEMKVDTLKLDRQFTQGEMNKVGNEGILKFFVDLAHRMELTVLAEGAETEEQPARLKEMNCDYVQGFYFSRPMSTEEYESLLKQQL